MRKIFTIFAAMLMALTVSARIVNIDNSSEGNFRRALRDAQAGDTIVLADGTYDEEQGFAVTKPITVFAAEGASPVVPLPSYIQVYASMKIRGVKFNGQKKGEHGFYIYPDSIKYFKLENCEMYNYPKYAISSNANAHIDSCFISNCYFHDNGRAAVYFPVSTTANQHVCNYVSVKNSTIANLTALNTFAIEVNNYNGTDADKFDKKVRLDVDHVTFYNCVTGSYGPIRAYYSHNVHITNCIFAQETTTSTNATYCYGSTSEISNCLSYNIGSHHSGPTLSDNITGNPLFVDAENGNFMLGAGSPAIGAATDGSNLGDPFWNTRTLYLKPGVWNADGDKFAIWCFGSGSHTSQWSGFMTQVGESDIYTTTIPAGFPTIIYARIAGNAASPNWNDKHNQTANQTINDALDMCKITAWGESGKDSPCEWFKYGIALYGDMNSWSKSADLLVADGDDYKITINLTAGDYEFKLIDHGDYRANGWWFKRDATTATGISADGTNMKIVADKDGDYVITWTRATGTLSVTFPSETALDNTVAGEKAVKVLRNGQLFIEKNGKTYNVLGTVVK